MRTFFKPSIQKSFGDLKIKPHILAPQAPIQEIIDALILVIENPNQEKPYQILKNCYNSLNLAIETEALSHLISQKFGDQCTSSS